MATEHWRATAAVIDDTVSPKRQRAVVTDDGRAADASPGGDMFLSGAAQSPPRGGDERCGSDGDDDRDGSADVAESRAATQALSQRNTYSSHELACATLVYDDDDAEEDGQDERQDLGSGSIADADTVAATTLASDADRSMDGDEAMSSSGAATHDAPFGADAGSAANAMSLEEAVVAYLFVGGLRLPPAELYRRLQDAQRALGHSIDFGRLPPSVYRLRRLADVDFVLRTDRLRARVHATTKDGADIEVQYADLCAVVSEMLGDPVAVARMRFVPRDDDVIGSGVDAHNFRGMCEALREAGRLVNAAEAAASRGTRLETLCVGLKFFMDAFELTRTRGSQHNAHVGVYFGLVNEPVRITGGAGRAVRTGLVAPKKAVPFELLQLFVPALIVLWHEGVVVEVAGVGLRRVFGAVVAGVTDHEERTVLACTKAAMGHFPVYHSTMPAAEIAARLARLGPLATAPEPPPRTVAMYRDFLAHVRTLTAADAAAASVLRGFVAPHTCARYGNGGVSPLVSLPYFNTCYLPYGMAVCYMHALPENLFRRLIESICRAAQRAGALDRINACTRRLGGYPTVKDVSRYGLVRLVRKRGGAPVVTASDTGAEMVDSALKACVFVLVGEACGDLETYTLLRHALRVMAWLQLGWYDAARLRELQRELDEFLRRWVLHFTARDWDGVGEPPPRDADAASVDFAYLVHVAAYPDYIAATGPPKDTDTRGAEHHHGVNRDAVLRSNRRSVSGTPLAAAESRAWRGRLLTLLPANVSTALTARPRRVGRFADGQAFGPSRIGVAVPLARAAVLAAAAPASAAPWPAHGGGATLREHQCRGVYLRGRRLALPSTAGAAATHAAARRPLCLVVELLVMSRDAAAAWRASLPGNAPVIGPDRMTGGAAKLEFTLLVERVVEVVVAAGATASDAAASGQRHTVLEGVLLRELPLADVRRTAPTCANAVESGCVAAVEKTALRLSVFVGPTAPGARIRAPWLERCDTAPHVLLSALHVDDVLLVQPHASVSHAATGAAPAGGDALAHAWSTAVRDLYEDNDYNSDDDTGEAW